MSRHLSFRLSLAAMFALGATAHATIYTWDGGATTTNWTDANNWNPNGAQAPLGVTDAHRLNVTTTQKVIYNYTLAPTNYTGDPTPSTGGNRGLVIGSGASARGELEITAGTFSTLGALGGDVIGNGASAIAALTISGGTFIGTNAGTNLGIGGGPTSTLNVSSGLATMANLNMNATTANINLSGTGVLEVNNITRSGGTGNLNFNGGTLRARIDTASFLTGLTAATINGGGATIDSTDKAITIAQALLAGTGSGGLTKTGSGTLTLSSSGNTYIGATQISGGTLALTGAGAINTSSGITINGSGAKLLHTGSTAISPAVTLTQGTLTGSGTVNTVNVGAGTGGIISNNNGVAGAALTIGTLTLSGGANINLFSSTTAAPLLVTTLTNNSAAGEVTITANNAGGWTNGSTYNLINYTTLNGTGLNNFAHAVSNLSARQSATWGDTGSAITLAIAGDTPYWTGAASGNWNGTDVNWKLITAGTDTTFLATDDVLFDDNATGTTSITIDPAGVAPNTVVFNNSTLAYTLGSAGANGITTGAITKNGSAALTINNANTTTGGTTLNAGTLNIGNADALGGVGNVFTINGGTIDNISGGALTTNNQVLSLNGDFAFTGSNDLNLGTGAATLGTAAGTSRTITVNGSKLTLANAIANGTTANSITKGGAGTLELTGANTLSGPATVNGGTLQISGGSAIANAGLVTLADVVGATFRVSGSETIGALAGGGATGGTVTIDAAQTLTLSSGTQTYAGTINGSGALTSSGAVQTLNGAISTSGGVNVTSARLTLGGNNSYTGQTNVSAGAGIIVTANNALGAGGIGNETLIAGTGGANSGAIGLSGGITYSTNEKIVGAGLGNTSANGLFASVQRGIVQSISGDNTFAGDIEINATGITRFGTQDGAQLTLSGTITAVSGASILIRAGQTNGDFVTLSGTSNSWDTDVTIFTGNTNALESAGLRLGADNAIPVASSVIAGSGAGAANTFDMAGFDQSLNGLANSTAPLKISNSNSLQESTLTLNLATVDRGTANTRIVDGAGTIRLVKQGNFTQTFSGNNNYSGTTTIEAGRILFGQVFSLYNGTSTSWTKENIIVNSGATLGLRVGGAGEFITTDVATILGNLTTGINNNGLQGGSLIGLEVNAVTTYSNVIADSTGTGSGSLGLVKSGTSDLTLDQSNTFSGGVVHNDGYLYAGHNNAFGTGALTIGSGAERLGVGNGINIGNNIVINGGGTAFNGVIQNTNLAAGENATVSGDITINANAASGGHFASAGTGSTLSLTGSITSSVSVQQRTGTVIYSGGGSYAQMGITGTARVGANNGLATNATADLGASGAGVLDLAGNNQSLVGITKNANAATIGNSSTATDSTLTLTGSSSFGGVIQDVLGTGNKKVNVTMNGAGETLTLEAANTYTGSTTVAAGVLALAGGGTISSSSEINVASGATFDVSGVTAADYTIGGATAQTLSGGGAAAGLVNASSKTLIMGNNATLSPGNSAGTLGVTGNLQLSTGTILNFELNPADTTVGGAVNDLVTVSGLLTLSGVLNVSGGDFSSLTSGTWRLFEYGSLSYTPANLTFGTKPTLQAGYSWEVQDDAVNNAVNLTIVPEPSTVFLGVFGVAGLALRRRRQA